MPGSYGETINHFNVLRTIEDMYGLPPAGASATATPITDIWQAPAASQLGVSAPSSPTAGAAFSISVTARDATGHTATGYLGTVHFTSSDAQAMLPAAHTFTAADAGVHTFNGEHHGHTEHHGRRYGVARHHRQTRGHPGQASS